MKRFNHIILIFSILFLSIPSLGQPAEGGKPLSFNSDLRADYPEVELRAPDMQKVKAEDIQREEQFMPPRTAVMVDAGIDFAGQARWSEYDGNWIARLALEVAEQKP